MEYLSKERYDEIAAELDHLLKVEYPKNRDNLAETRAQGDLSENFGYHAAKRALGKTIGRIRFLQKVLQHSRVIDTSELPKDCVTLLSKVKFTNMMNGLKMEYTIVSPHEMDLKSGKISFNSPIGQALMGKKVGDIVEVHAPASDFRFRIDEIS